MSLVLDGSAALAWCFVDETTPAFDALMLRVAREGARVPSLWRLEVANGLQAGIRRGRLTPAYRDGMLTAFAEMDIATDSETDRYAWTTTVRLAERHALTIYDASTWNSPSDCRCRRHRSTKRCGTRGGSQGSRCWGSEIHIPFAE
jgi:predicted nucleic acid-binding protein